MSKGDDIIIRDATLDDAAGIGRVHVESWRTTYAGLVPDDYLTTLSYDAAEKRWRGWMTAGPRRTIMLVAIEPGGRIIGFANGGKERSGHTIYTGELYAIYLLQEAQGSGTGRRLICEIATRLLAEGYGSMIVWVLAKNPSRGFYRKLGGKLVDTKMISIGGAELQEEAYGWKELDGLVG